MDLNMLLCLDLCSVLSVKVSRPAVDSRAVVRFDGNCTSKLWLRHSSRDWEHAVKLPCCRWICAISRWASA